jgi:mono/diheme cytochrome c family protein
MRRIALYKLGISVPLWVALSVVARAQVPSDSGIDFLRDIQPIFEVHCFACHGPEKQKSGFRLDVKSRALQGGDHYGPMVDPNDPYASPLLEWVKNQNPQERMPPPGPANRPLSPSQIETLEAWFAAGAPWPDGVDKTILIDPKSHWSFQPLPSPDPHASIDTWIEAKLLAQGLSLSPPALPMQWLRRVSLDLHGLPPAPELAAWFAQHQEDPEVYSQAVDQLLASPRYAERWAQHWLDVVRYADTHGFEVNTERPHAWHYRDYVIRALQNDTPFDQFIREQIAGDQLGQDTATGFLITASVLLPGQIGADEPSKRLARQDAIDEIVVNLSQSFLGLSIGCARCHDHKFDPISQVDYYAMQAFVAGVDYEDRLVDSPWATENKERAERISDELRAIDRELLRFETLARPNPQRIQSGTDIPSLQDPVGGLPKRPRVQPKINSDRIVPTETRGVRFSILQTNRLEPCIDEFEIFNPLGENVALSSRGTQVTSSGDSIAPDRHELRLVNDGNYGNSRSWMSNQVGKGTLTFQFADPVMVERLVWGRDRLGEFQDRMATQYTIELLGPDGQWTLVADDSDRDSDSIAPDSRASVSASNSKSNSQSNSVSSTAPIGPTEAESEAREALQTRQKQLQNDLKTWQENQKAFAGRFRTPDAIHLLLRGDPEQPQQKVEPRIPGFFGQLGIDASESEPKRRLAIADWIASPSNPLTPRVIANRIWQGHFGIGLVDTPNDFGIHGQPPSHPELLDWLAAELIANNWSLKSLHRAIVLSKTYRQSSQSHEKGLEIDADGRLLWRYPLRRLEAEAIRDSILAVSGQLNTTMFGRGYDLFAQRGGLSGFQPIEQFQGQGLRRMIYAHKVRREREAVFGAFDCPDAGQSTGLRRTSTTPIQALNLLNSVFTIEQSKAFAERLHREAGSQIQTGSQVQTGNQGESQADPTQLIQAAYQHSLCRDPTPDEIADALPIVQELGVETLCRALFNCNEFLFLP